MAESGYTNNMSDPGNTEASSNPSPMKPKEVRETIDGWFKKIHLSKALIEKVAADYTWKDIIDEYHGKYNWSRWGLSDIYIPPLNLIFAYVQTEIPAMVLRDPHIKVNPKNEQSIGAAKLMEKAINYVWRHHRIKRENTKNITDALLVGHSWFKVGYSGDFGTAEDSNGNRFEFIEKEDFFGYRIPWDCVYFNPDSLDPPYDCTWIAHEIWATKENVEKNPLYNQEAVKKLQYGAKKQKDNVSKGTVDYNSYSPSDEANLCCLYEVWNKEDGTKFTISPGVNLYLEEPKPWPYEMRGFPFSFICFNPSPSYPYGIPDVYVFRPQVLELIKVYAMMLDHLKRFNRQLIVKGTPLSADHMAMLKQGVTGAVLNEVAADTTIEPIVYPPIQQDVYAVERLLKEMMINISGQSASERGASQVTSTRTMGELEMMKEGNKNRRSRKIDLVEDFVEDIAGNMLALLQQFADVPFYVRLIGDEFQDIQQALASRPSAQQPGSIAGPSGFTFTKEDIQGEFDLDVVAGSMAPLDRPTMMNTLMQLIPELQQLGVMPGGPVAAAIGSILAENLEMPEINKAMKDEAIQKQKQMEKQDQLQAQNRDLNVAEATSKMNIDAANVAVKQNKLVVEAMKHVTPGGNQQVPEAENTGPRISESISFKDLPPEGQIQMASQAGIILTTEQIKALQDHALKVAKSKPKAGG